ncbi:LON peptidase N-terminal domain and RING finger protein 1-like isoform X2 [Salvia splendens]|uniref:LON peptidase N-terminal domain and RING finger protein 1-like isoform X2 n=1 Tax=Salvia splendens TaxID=180675 RepID=UPI001C278627|nr:LON peptidase N-terminal domain and RING finger protein 1-like isoform X2 [Salvia splendens]
METSPAAGFSLEGIDDVQDLPWQNEEGSSISWERYSHLYDLMHRGNTAFREDRLDQAIELYSRANHIKPGDSIILSNRCAAYLRISQFLRSRPPSASEHRPLNGLDPTTHAGLALNDAVKVMNLESNTAASYILKANALILLEKYELAQDVIWSGLQIDPQSNALSNLEKKIANNFSRRSHVNPQRTDDYDCTLCLKLLYEPITTPCGHSFCRSCLFQTMDRGNRCPLCRTVLFISPRTCAISVTLNNIIEKSFPEEYAERKLEQLSLTNPGPDLLPLFAMDVILPCQKLQLNIFEPRYRLMVRRIMEGNRRMGMVVIDPSTGSVVDYACEVEITDCEPLPDGRFFLEVESRRRCRIIRNWDQDGYRVAEVEWVNDISPPEGSERNDLLEMTNKAAVFARQWINEAQEAAQGGNYRIRLAELFKAEGLMPPTPTRDPERFSFWLATLTNRRPSERLELLRLSDTRERITRSLLFMKAEEQGCRLQ